MQEGKKLAEVSLGIKAKKTTLLKKSKPLHALFEACVIENITVFLFVWSTV